MAPTSAVAQDILENLLSKFEIESKQLIDAFSQSTEEEDVTQLFIMDADPGSNDIPPFDQLITSFATVSRHSVDTAVSAVCEWHAGYVKQVEQHAASPSRETKRSRRLTVSASSQQPNMSNLPTAIVRRNIAADYIFSKAFMQFLSAQHQSSLSPTVASRVEDTVVDYFKEAQRRQKEAEDVGLAGSRSHVTQAMGRVVGLLSIKRFQTITDKFLKLLNTSSSISFRSFTSSSTSSQHQFIRALKHVRLQVTRQDTLDSTCKFLNKVLDIFKKAKGSEDKDAFCEALANMLAPVVVHNISHLDTSKFDKIVGDVYSIAERMSRKSKYTAAALPLVSAALAVMPKDQFMNHFRDHLEVLFKHVKEGKMSQAAMDCVLHSSTQFVRHVLQGGGTDVLWMLETLESIANSITANRTKCQPAHNLLPLYESMVDVIVAISMRKPAFCMDSIILPLLRDGNAFTEAALIGLRGFAATADATDVFCITQESPEGIPYPGWVLAMFRAAATRSVSSSEASSEIRLASPFSWYGQIEDTYASLGMPSTSPSSHSLATSVSTLDTSPAHSGGQLSHTGSSSTGHRPTQSMGGAVQDYLSAAGGGELFREDLQRYGMEISERVGRILQELDDVFRPYSRHASRPLDDAKEKQAGIPVFEAAISCLKRIRPSNFTAAQLAEKLAQWAIHQSKGVREAAWDVLQDMMDTAPAMRPVIIEAYADMLGTIPVTALPLFLPRLSRLLLRWRTVQESYTPPDPIMAALERTLYGEFSQPPKSTFDFQRVEAVLLSSLVSGTDTAPECLRALHLVSDIVRNAISVGTSSGPPSPFPELPHNSLSAPPLYDVLDAAPEPDISRLLRCASHHLTQNQKSDPQSIPDKFPPWHEVIVRLSRFLSDMSPDTSTMIVSHVLYRVNRISFSSLASASSDTLNVWGNYARYACAASTFASHQGSELFSDLIKYIIKHGDTEERVCHTIIQALGSVHYSNAELLLAQMAPVDQEVTASERSKGRKRGREDLRRHAAQVYSSVSFRVWGRTVAQSVGVRARLLKFVHDTVNYLKNVPNSPDPSVHAVRTHTFRTIENMAYKLYHHPVTESSESAGWSVKERMTYLSVVMPWTGFGNQGSRTRIHEEARALENVLERIRDPEEAKQYQESAERAAQRTQMQACRTVAALVLGPFDDREDVFKHWCAEELSSASHMELPSERSGPAYASLGPNSSLSDGRSSVRLSKFWTRRSGGHSGKSSDGDSGSGGTGSWDSMEGGMNGVTALQWINDMVANGTLTDREVGYRALNNMLVSNPHLAHVFLDLTYHNNDDVAKAYLLAVLNVFRRRPEMLDIGASELVVLFLVNGISSDAGKREAAIEILRLAAQQLWPNTPPFLHSMSSALPDAYLSVVNSVSSKLALDHPDIALHVITTLSQRINMLRSVDPSRLLNAFVPWIPFLPVSHTSPAAPRDPTASNPNDTAFRALFDITWAFSERCPGRCRKLWTKLAEEEDTVNEVMDYILRRGMVFSSSRRDRLFAVLSRIALYMSAASPRRSIAVLMEELEAARGMPTSSDTDAKEARRRSTQVQKAPETSSSGEDSSLASSSSKQRMASVDVALVLLAEMGAENQQAVKEHLPTLLHFAMLRMDSKRPLIHQAAKIMLVNLINSFVLLTLSHSVSVENKEKLQRANDLVGIVAERQRNEERLWGKEKDRDPGEDNNEAERELTDIVGRTVAVFDGMISGLRHQWRDEALAWATHSAAQHTIVRSCQIYTAVAPTIVPAHIPSILPVLQNALADALHSATKAAVAVEVLRTFRRQTSAMPTSRLLLFPHLFWVATSALYTHSTPVYTHAVSLLSVLMDKLDLRSISTQHLLFASQPSSLPGFRGLLPALLPGLAFAQTRDQVTRILCRLAQVSQCDDILDSNRAPHQMLLIGLLPFLCHAADGDEREDAIPVAMDLARCLQQHGQPDVAVEVKRFADSEVRNGDVFLSILRPVMGPMMKEESPHSTHATLGEYSVALMHAMLHLGPEDYRPAILNILYTVLQDVVDVPHIPHLFRRVTSLVEASLWQEAVRVLDVAVAMSCRDGGRLSLNNGVPVKDGTASEHGDYDCMDPLWSKMPVQVATDMLEAVITASSSSSSSASSSSESPSRKDTSETLPRLLPQPPRKEKEFRKRYNDMFNRGSVIVSKLAKKNKPETPSTVVSVPVEDESIGKEVDAALEQVTGLLKHTAV